MDAVKRRQWVLLGIGLAAVGACTVLSGGLAVSRVRDFGGQAALRLADGLQAYVWLAPRSTSFGVPFVFHYYSAGRPFGLHIHLWDDRRQYRTIAITEVVLAYQDGVVVRKQAAWTRQLHPFTQFSSSAAGLIRTEMFMLSDRLEGLVGRHTDVTITLKGQLVKVNGERVAFEAAASFKAESRLRV